MHLCVFVCVYVSVWVCVGVCVCVCARARPLARFSVSSNPQIDGMATVHMLDPTRAGERAIQSSPRHVRTRLCVYLYPQCIFVTFCACIASQPPLYFCDILCMYFTSESHIVSLMNILRFAPNKGNELGGGIGVVTTQQGLDSISHATEMNYLSSIVIKLCKQQSKSNDDPWKYKIEISCCPTPQRQFY